MVLEIYFLKNYSIFENRKPIMLELRTAERVGKNYKTFKEQKNYRQNLNIFL